VQEPSSDYHGLRNGRKGEKTERGKRTRRRCIRGSYQRSHSFQFRKLGKGESTNKNQAKSTKKPAGPKPSSVACLAKLRSTFL